MLVLVWLFANSRAGLNCTPQLIIANSNPFLSDFSFLLAATLKLKESTCSCSLWDLGP